MDLTPLRNLISFIQTLPAQVAVSTDRAIGENAEDLVSENIKQIEQRGRDSEGVPIRYRKIRRTPADGVYSVGHARKKRKLGLNTSFVDLKVDGDFLRSIQLLRESPGHWNFTSQGDLLTHLIAMYGDSILGVENLQRISEEKILPSIVADIEKRLTER